MRYTLLRCAGYTRNKATVEQVTFYVLLAAGMFPALDKGNGQLGRFVDFMVDAVFKDMTADPSENIAASHPAGDNQLLDNADMYKFIESLNRLDGFTRQVLVLGLMEMLSTKQIAQIYNKSIPEIRSALEKGAEQLVGYLKDTWPERNDLSAENVCFLFAELEEAFDPAQSNSIIASISAFLSGPKPISPMLKRYLNYWNRN